MKLAFESQEARRKVPSSIWIWFFLFAVGCGGSESGPPNVLVITLDTTRADRLGCYGYERAHTPHLDRIATEGVVFEEALTAVPVTFPAHSSIFTGQYPLRHGVRNNGSYLLRPQSRTLAEAFDEMGYETAAFVSAYVLNKQFGLGQGFNSYDDQLFNERSGPKTTDLALEWFANRPSHPFFLWVHYFDPHTPWTPGPFGRSLDLFDDYDREIAVVDHQIGRLLEALEADESLENTCIIVVGDHGEGLDDHGEFEHGIFLYRETTRVPFLIRFPDKINPGSRVSEPVATVDIFPTALDIAGIAPRENPAEVNVLDGFSLIPLIATGQSPDRRGIYMETRYPEENFGWAPLTAFESGSWKWIDGPEAELYDLASDPGERKNLRESRAEDTERMKGRLDRLRQTIGEPAARPQTMSAEVEERLRSLGYLSGSEIVDSSNRDLPDPKDMIEFHSDFEEAKRAMDDTRFADAVAPFYRVLENNPTNSVARLGLGVALTRISSFAEAEDVLRVAIRENPRNSTVRVTLADAIFGQERYEESLELYRLSSTDPTLGTRHVPTRILLCLHRLERTTEVQGMLNQLAAGATPDDRGYFQSFAGRLGRDRQFSATLPPAALVEGSAPADVIERVRISAGIGLGTEALRFLQTPLQDPEFERQRLELLVQLYQETRRPGPALETLDLLVDRFGESTPRRQQRARYLLELHRYEEALVILDEMVVGVPPTTTTDGGPGPRAGLEYQRARALSQIGRAREAISALRVSVEAGFDRPIDLFNDPDLASLHLVPGYLDFADSLAAALP